MIPPGSNAAIIAINDPKPAPPAVQAPTTLGSPPPGGKPPLPTIPIAAEALTDVGKTASVMSPDQLIDYAQNIRKGVVDGYVSQGIVPKGTADKLMFAGMLKDLVDTEFAKKKADVDAKTGAASALVAEILAAVPKRAPVIVQPGVTDVTPKELPTNIPTAPLVPGEAETEPAQMDIASFMRDTDPKP